MEIEEPDRRLLRVLQLDAGQSIKQLAERAGLSASTAWRRLQALESAGVVRGRVALLDPERLGLDVCALVEVDIAGQSAETRAEFERFVRAAPEILQCYAVTGGHDYTLVVRTPSVGAYERFLMDRLLQHPAVASTQTHLVLRQPKDGHALPV
ncbi:MAG: Lrp/AsnC family transcriptional regulator [Pseudomonadota bacterium]